MSYVDTHARFGAGVPRQWLTYNGGSMSGKVLETMGMLSEGWVVFRILSSISPLLTPTLCILWYT